MHLSFLHSEYSFTILTMVPEINVLFICEYEMYVLPSFPYFCQFYFAPYLKFTALHSSISFSVSVFTFYFNCSFLYYLNDLNIWVGQCQDWEVSVFMLNKIIRSGIQESDVSSIFRSSSFLSLLRSNVVSLLAILWSKTFTLQTTPTFFTMSLLAVFIKCMCMRACACACVRECV